MCHQPNSALRRSLRMGALALALGVWTSPSHAQTVIPPGNLGLTGSVVDATRDRLLVALREAGTDLNGDSDGLDTVALLLKTATGHSTTYPYALSGVTGTLDDRYLMLRVRELDQSADLNGDGDLDDTAYRSVYLRTGEVIDIPLGTDGTSARIAGNTLAYLVWEYDQASTDLNGDGDILDRVLHLHDLETGVTTNLGLALFASGHLRTDGNAFFAEVSQSSQGGTDLSASGGLSGDVLHLIDTAGQVINTSVVPLGGYVASSESMVMTVHEFTSGDDVDGSGSLLGSSLALMDASTGAWSYLGENNLFQIVSQPLAQQAGKLYLSIELAFSKSLYRFDPTAGSLEPLSALTNALIQSSQILAVGDDLLGVEILENGADLNGDGDTTDVVYQVLDAATLTTVHDLQVASGGLAAAAGDVVLTTISEKAQGMSDRNGDGDTSDITMLALDLRSGHTREFPYAVSSLATNGQLIAFTVSEAGQGSTDLNGDGDASDHVLHVFDIRRGNLHSLQAATSTGNYFLDGRAVAFNVIEQDQGGLDLDGDGSSDDLVAHRVGF